MTPAMLGIIPNAACAVEAAQLIQLYMAYAPQPPFNSGTPETSPAAILNETRRAVADITTRREATARRIAARLGVDAG